MGDQRSKARCTASLSERLTRAPIGFAIQTGGAVEVGAASSFSARASRSDTSLPKDLPFLGLEPLQLPEDGVVDIECRSHGMLLLFTSNDNVFDAVMQTSGLH